MERPIFGISRHRMGIYGNGITTLVAFMGCPLKCIFLQNPISSAESVRPLFLATYCESRSMPRRANDREMSISKQNIMCPSLSQNVAHWCNDSIFDNSRFHLRFSLSSPKKFFPFTFVVSSLVLRLIFDCRTKKQRRENEGRTKDEREPIENRARTYRELIDKQNP